MLAEKPDLVVAFPGDSDTRHMVIIADEAGVKVVYAVEVRTPWSGIEQA